MQQAPATFNPLLPYVTLRDGSVFQVLNEDQTDWDEAATAAQVQAYVAANPGA